MSDSATSSIRFDTPTTLAVEAAFDGGLPWLSEGDRKLGLCAAIAACVPEWGRGSLEHSLDDLVLQRVYQIACGYEDQDEADSLRSDPLRLISETKYEAGSWGVARRVVD